MIYLGHITEFPPGSLTPIEAGGQSLLVVHTDAGLFVVVNRCPHLGLQLDNGTAVGQVLICLWHGAQFRLTDGENLRWAANEPNPPGQPRDPARCLPVFPVRQVEGELYIAL